MTPNVQRYISPKERAEMRARRRAWLFWTAVTLPALIALIMFGYSDQSPAWLRGFTVTMDATFGYPVLWLIKAVAS